MIMRAKPPRHLLCATAIAALAVTTLTAQVAPPVEPPITDPATYAGHVPPNPVPGAPRPAPSPVPAPPAITAPFALHVIASNIRGAYVVTPIDMNKDGKIDLIALGQREDYLVWYENPYWTPHIIRTPVALPQMVNMDAVDLDGDGIPEIGVTYSFNMNPALSTGNIAILHSTKGDATAPWTMKVVDQVPSPHRLRFADVDGSGKWAMIVAPILNAKSQPVPTNDPDHLPTPLLAYRAPDWKRILITEENRGPVHGIQPFDWNGDGRQEVLTMGQSGIFAHGLSRDGKWTRAEIVPGNPAPWPNGGASDIAIGKLAGKQFFAAIEPVHGNLAVVYTQDAQGHYRRNVIDNDLRRGHAITLVDVDGDGVPEIVAGGGGSVSNIFLYKASDPSGRTWTKQLMDNNLAPAECVTTDLKGSGKNSDVVCVDGQAPFDLKWYEYIGG
jgi:hypothetical protein